MTANHAHTPTTGQVETGFALYLYDYENIVISSGRDRFKAWLAERDARIEAAAEQRGAERVLAMFQEAVNEMSIHSLCGTRVQEIINRADRIANKEGGE